MFMVRFNRSAVISVPPFSMLQWIANLLRRTGIRDANDCGVRAVLTHPKVIASDNVRVEVLEFELSCGHVGYGIEVSYFVEDQNEWMSIASLRDYNIHHVLGLLVDAAKYVDSLPNEKSPPECGVGCN